MSVWDCFEHKSGSKVWPSSDPSDSPFDRFTCKVCGKVFSVEMYGATNLGEPTFETAAFKLLGDHISGHISK
ncbi:MAG: hypothetical protein EHM26_07725 [Desulfobacteraceae bacterium]|nr:MAG: hypothetical protein EHM26_07725 [Desulfobacteraceae bacterium]